MMSTSSTSQYTYPNDERISVPYPREQKPPTPSSTSDNQNAPQAYIHHDVGPDPSDVLTLFLPAEFSLSVPPHFHCKNTEWMKVFEGEVHAIVDGKGIVMRPEDDWLVLPPYTSHSFDKLGGEAGKKTIWRERNGPESGLKRRFFQDFLARDEVSWTLQMGALSLALTKNLYAMCRYRRCCCW